MEFQDVLRRRRMVRNYRPDPVDPESLERVLAAFRRAPSAGHAQGQHLVVVTEAGMRRRLAELAGEPAYVARGFEPWLSVAPVHLVLCAREEDYRRRYREPDKAGMDWPVPYWFVDAGCAMMAVLLAAVDEGLAAGFQGIHRMPGLAALLGIPADVAPVGVLTLGHPAPDRRSGSLSRGRRVDTVHRGRWEAP